MLHKKSSNANLENKRSVALLMGLVIALSVLYVALEWSHKEITVYTPLPVVVTEPEVLFTPPTPPPPRPAPPKSLVQAVVKPEIVMGGFNPVDSLEQQDSALLNDWTERLMDDPIFIGGPIVEDSLETVPFMPGWAGMPEFMEGDLQQYLAKHVRYPGRAITYGIKGTVICQFVIDKDGTITDIKIVRSIDPDLDNEVIRVVENMPSWTPGVQNGKPVKVQFTLPVKFDLKN